MAPPKKVTREAVVAAARSLVVEAGPSALNARDLGLALGVSARPLYSHFASMDDLKAAVFDGLFADYQAALTTPQDGQDRFLDVGLAEVRYARDFPREYRLVHDQEGRSPGRAAGFLERTLDHLEASGPYLGFPRAVLKDLLVKMALFTHGLALAVNSGQLLDVTDEDLSRYLTETGVALITWARHSASKEGAP